MVPPMGTCHRYDNVRVMIYSNDHAPEHVHVIGPDWQAVFDLHCPDGPPELREVHDAGASQLNNARAQVLSVLAKLCRDWKSIHG